MNAETEAEQSRRRQRRTQRAPRRASQQESQPTVDQMIDEVVESPRYRELFDVHFHGPEGREHRFRRELARATNRQVHHRDSWDEIQRVVRYVIYGLPLASRLNMDVLGSLYIAEREALIRLSYDFPRRYFSEDIARRLEVARTETVSPLANQADRDFYSRFAQRIFVEAIFRR